MKPKFIKKKSAISKWILKKEKVILKKILFVIAALVNNMNPLLKNIWKLNLSFVS